MTSNYITFKKNKFHYRQFGKGGRLLFCFHGYGRDSYTFGFLAKVLGSRYTIIAIDAPYHGHTQWDDLEFDPKDLVQVLREIQQQAGFESKKITLLGFSMGGRIALHIAEEMAANIERIVLLAPDGLRYNFWQWFSTHTWLGLKVFDFTINHPAWFLRLVNVVEKRKIVSRNLTNMVRYYFEDNDQRLILYRRWIIMRKFKPHLGSLKKRIAKNNIRLRMLFGSYDRVIHSAGGHAFLETIEEYASVKIIDAGHDLLREWHSATIAELFND
jgi:pimeloyl-ACP methyl ester carboxylesterase